MSENYKGLVLAGGETCLAILGKLHIGSYKCVNILFETELFVIQKRIGSGDRFCPLKDHATV